MAQHVRDVMTPDPIFLQKDATVAEAANTMKQRDIGDILVCDAEELYGIVTDRDIVIRVLAEGKDPEGTTVGEIASTDLATIGPDDKVDDAVKTVRDRAIRRLPVVDSTGPAVGIVSIGDLALEKDPNSALADISAAPPNA